MNYKLITEANVEGKTVLVRSSLNVPVLDRHVLDDFRIRQATETIKYLQEKKAKKIIIIAHIGRSGKETLQPVAHELKKHLLELRFVQNYSELLESKYPLILYENLRRDPRETENDTEFAKKLASIADIFVQDAFSVCHREHASIVSLPKFLPSYAGFLLDKEVKNISKATNPENPSLFILGGSKFKTKEKLLKNELQIYDDVLVAGALANDFFKSKGISIGDSLSSGKIPPAILQHFKLSLPEQVIVRLSNGEAEKREVTKNLCQKGESIVDALVPRQILSKIKKGRYKTIVWNGPLGFYEGGFYQGTVELAEALSVAKEKGSFILIGGGDTVSALRKKNLKDCASFLSTAGGAMLEFLLYKTLPGIEALS